MAWNGSGGSTTPPKKAKVSGTGSSSLFRGIAALLLVLVIGGVAYLFVAQELPKVNEPTEEKAEKKAIEVVEPEIAERVEVEEVKVEKPKRPKKYWEEDVMPANLTRAQQQKWKIAHMPPAGITNDTSRTEAKPAYQIFDHNSENEIASLLTMNPGETLVGDPGYERWFVRDFLKSIEQPIIVTKDDTPEEAALKRDMIEVKKDLKARYDEGEDIAEVMRKTREEYQDLCQYKEEVRRLFYEAKREHDLTETDVEDLVNACNKMLEDKGISPLNLGPISKRMLLKRQGDY